MTTALSKAKEEMANSLIELCDFTITVPLSDKTKNIRTNSFIYLEPIPQIEDVSPIYEALTSKSGTGARETRQAIYRKGYWYVKGVDIKYGDEKTMELTLAPLPTVYQSNYTGSNNSSSKTSSSSKSDSKTSTKKSNNTTLKAPSFLSKKDKTWAVNTVQKAISTKKDKLAQAKAIYNYFKDRYSYKGYSDLRYTTAKGNRESAFKKGAGNCADGANILETLFLTAGLNARIKHPYNHYIIKLKINGKTYWCDNRGTKAWNTVWEGRTSNNESNITGGQYING